MAKTYKQVNSTSSILILDKTTSIGGVWAQDRLYPGLKTNNHFGTFEFSDFPMRDTGLRPDQHIPGKIVHDYLESYATEFDLLRHVRCSCKVVSAENKGIDGWLLNIKQNNNPIETVLASRLVIATGLTSDPFVPEFKGQADFEAPIIHSSQFGAYKETLIPSTKVVILSGAKFSWDAAYAYAIAGADVHWILRKSGRGACIMAPSLVTPLKLVPEKFLNSRILTFFSPCSWGDADGYGMIRRFLHQSWLGKKLVRGLFDLMTYQIQSEHGYDNHPETAKLKPWDDMMFVGTNRGVMNYDTPILDLVREGKIKVHVADITHLTSNKVHLSNDQVLDADMLICGTGWKSTPPVNFISPNVNISLPQPINATSPSTAEADERIFADFPMLQPSASTIDKAQTTEPYRLYRFMIPPAFIASNHRTLAFTGAHRSPQTTLIAQTQALWLTAFFANALPHLAPSPTLAAETQWEAVLHSQFYKWRYPKGFGGTFPEIWFESLPYIDLMLKELGLQRWRKSSAWRECIMPYIPEDYIGLVEEWTSAQERLDVNDTTAGNIVNAKDLGKKEPLVTIDSMDDAGSE